MKLITTASVLEKEFRRLIQQYDQFYCATAWAGTGSKHFDILKANERKIEKMVVGIHFYQTHPDFIEEFLNDTKVRFIEQPEGTFHPKLYLFSDNANKWEMIVGSPNFTNAAFTRNTEASILITQMDNNASATYKSAMKFIDKTFSVGMTYNKSDLDQYRKTWNILRPKLKALSGKYASKKGNSKPSHRVPIMNKSWDDFMNEVKNETSHRLEERLKVIEIAKNLFTKFKHFHELKEDERKFIAGIPNKLEVGESVDCGYFGSMKGSGIYSNRIIQNDKNISKALDQIPLSGQITEKFYSNYIKYFAKAISGNYIGTATRLLCMKRPDTFVCLDDKNRSALCKDFRIIQSNMDYNRYWNDIVLRIYDCEWWQNPTPKNDIEVKVREARAAFLDSLYYKK